jgi:hypothetical protein
LRRLLQLLFSFFAKITFLLIGTINNPSKEGGKIK